MPSRTGTPPNRPSVQLVVMVIVGLLIITGWAVIPPAGSADGTDPVATPTTAGSTASSTAPSPDTAPPGAPPATAPPSTTPPPTAGPAVPPPPPVVLAFGDSLGTEVGPALQANVAPDLDVRVDAFPGSGLCDYLPAIREGVETLRPAAVVLMFAGNTFTPCTRPGGSEPTDAEREVQFVAEMEEVAALGAPVVVVGEPPLPYAFALRPQLNDAFRDMARRQRAAGSDVRFVDAGPALAGPDGEWVPRLPCLPHETSLAECEDGSIAVRGPDGRHFCPVPSQYVDPCPVRSSGAERMAAVVAGPLRAASTPSPPPPG